MNRDAAPLEFHLDPALDTAALTAQFQEKRRVRIANFLQPDSALALYRHLSQEITWSSYLGADEKNWEATAKVRGHYTDDQHRELASFAYAGARSGFAYFYEGDRHVSLDRDKRAEDTTLLARFLDFANSPGWTDVIRRITGLPHVSRVDAQATCYRPGHFLTCHDDSTTLKGRDRSAARQAVAYVLNLTPNWRLEWGGLLQFISDEGQVEEAYVPGFNVLSLFAVPKVHSVSFVAPFAEGARYAISGWLYVPVAEQS